MFFKKTKAVVGVDIGSSSVKAIALAKTKRGYQVIGFACEPLLPDAVVDGAITDSASVAETIKKMFTSAGFKTKTVATGISGHSVIVKRVVLPAVTPEDVEASIQLDAEQYIPFQLSEVNLDYQVIGPAATGDGLEVLLVVAKKEKVQNQTNVISMAGRTPEVVDIDAFALQNAFEANYTPDPNSTIALLNIGATLMNINIMKGGVPLFIRDVSVGGNQYTDILQKELQLSFQEAEDLKLGKAVGQYDPEIIEPLLESITEMLTLEVQKTFDFFRETYPSEVISSVYLSGGTSSIPSVATKIQERFGYPTEVMNPFKSVEIGGKVKADQVHTRAPALAVAVGLALRGFE